MTKKLNFGETINLSRENPKSKKLKIGVNWDLKEDVDADLDASILVLEENGKLVREDSIVYYNNLKLYGGAIHHSGDVYRPGITKDEETIYIDFTKLPKDVKIILIVVTIFNREGSPKTTFECIKNTSIKLCDADTDETLYTFNLAENDLSGTAVEMGRICLKDGEWEFTALDEVIATTHNGLQGVINKYNSNVIIDKCREKMMTMITPIRNRIIRTPWKKRQRDY